VTSVLGFLHSFFYRNTADILIDVADVLIVAFLLYRILVLIRGTRAMQMGVGLTLVFVVYQFAKRLGFVTLYTILGNVLAYIVLVIVVIFQADIRRALVKVGRGPLFRFAHKERETRAIDEVVQAVGMLSHKSIGALIVFERDAALDEFLQSGSLIDAAVTKELLYSIFVPAFENPIHDGAVVIRDERIWQAGAFLPLTISPRLDRALGTRHRAAIGLSEETDAVVIVVSEERGEISLCFNGNIVRNLSIDSLREALHGLFYGSTRKRERVRTTSVPPVPPPTPASVRTTQSVQDGE